MVVLHQRDLVAAADRSAGVPLRLCLPLRALQTGGPRRLATTRPAQSTPPGYRSSRRRSNVFRAAGILVDSLQERDLSALLIHGYILQADVP